MKWNLIESCSTTERCKPVINYTYLFSIYDKRTLDKYLYIYDGFGYGKIFSVDAKTTLTFYHNQNICLIRTYYKLEEFSDIQGFINRYRSYI